MLCATINVRHGILVLPFARSYAATKCTHTHTSNENSFPLWIAKFSEWIIRQLERESKASPKNKKQQRLTHAVFLRNFFFHSKSLNNDNRMKIEKATCMRALLRMKERNKKIIPRMKGTHLNTC